MIVYHPETLHRGRVALKTARNDVVTDGDRVASLARGINNLAARRMKVHFRKYVPGNVASGTSTVWRWRMRTSPNVREVRARVLFAPGVLHTGGASVWGFQMNIGGVLQDFVGTGGIGASVSPNVLQWAEQTLVDGVSANLAPSTDYECSFGTYDESRILGVCIYELARPSLDTAVDVAVPEDVFGVGSQIVDTYIADMLATAHTVYREQGTPHFAWSVDDGAAKTQTGTTWKNPLNGSTFGWSSTALGWYLWPYRHGSLTTKLVDCIFAVRAKTNTGSGGRARLVGLNGVVATITGIGTTEQWYETACQLATDSSDNGVYVLEHSDSGGNTISTTAAELREYTAP